MRRPADPRAWPLLLLGALALLVPSDAVAARDGVADLADLSLEELMTIKVTTVSRKGEAIGDAAAAVHVITAEDLQRLGVSTLADALRLAPGLQVARINASTWAVTARGFNGQYANKLLVLIDGRTVYTPLFSGVYWDVQDLPLEDIERIEIIRGPGATMWGANAVNGVINIITKSARETTGQYVKLGGGSNERMFTTLRHGEGLDRIHYRVYAKYFDRGGSPDTTGADEADDWHVSRVGFRTDWQASNSSTMILQGGVYNGRSGVSYSLPQPQPPHAQLLRDETRMAGGYILGRWVRTFSTTSELSVRSYFDRTERHDVFLGEDRNTFDLDVQHGLMPLAGVEVMYGFGFRHTTADYDTTYYAFHAAEDHQLSDELYSAFIQTGYSPIPDRLRLTLGSKFEHNDLTGGEYQPSLRLLWTPRANHSVWAAISRAVRTPARVEHFGRLRGEIYTPLSSENPTEYPVGLELIGSESFESEKLLAYELGYRLQPTGCLSLDLATFYNEYRDLRSIEPGVIRAGAPPSPTLILPLHMRNGVSAETYGVEAAFICHPSSWLGFHGSYSFLRVINHWTPTGLTRDFGSEGAGPRHSAKALVHLDLSRALELNVIIRIVDKLRDLRVPSLGTADTRLAWRPRTGIELALVGRNLVGPRTHEFKSDLRHVLTTEREPSLHGVLQWRF
ncbi:MAG: TonB-dependent receptor plug domain-containing protein [Candidatus Eisenbacteria bacterium]|nr:TonB-dependent receptor plug domain-containing protein [Candidatus Eisenbacteria bacterium]